MIPSKLKTILGIGLMGMAILVMPFGEFKPNRVIQGTLLSAFDLFGVWLTGLILLVLLVMLILALRMKRKPSWFIALTAMLLTVLPSLVLMALSAATLTIDGVNPAASRISLGLGFYVLMVGILVLLSQYKTFRWILLLMSLMIGLTLVFNQIPNLGLVKEFNNVQDKMAQAIQTHLILALSSALTAVIPGIWLGYLSFTKPRWREWVMGMVNVFQVAPTLSLLGWS